MKKKYYKVVSPEQCSAVAKNPLLKVKYVVGEWTTPRLDGTSLMVFDNLEAAKRFAIGSHSLIYECKIKNPKKKGVFTHWLDVGSFKDEIPIEIQHQLQLKKLKKKYFCGDLYRVPPGTVFCSAVKLIKEVL